MVALAFLIPLALLVKDLAADRALTMGERDAETFGRFLGVLAPARGVADAVAILNIESFSRFDLSVVLPDGTTYGVPVDPGEDLDRVRQGAAYRAPVTGGQAVYVPVHLADEPTALVVRVLVPDEAMWEGVGRSWLTLGLLGLLLVMIAILVTDRLGRTIVQPVRELSATAARLGEGDLDARVSPAGPEEIREVGTEFNRLAGRIVRLLQHEREAAADLSHRLRTPLTAVRLDAESLPEGPRKERLLDDLDELARTIDFVIREARRPVRQETEGSCDLAAVARSRVEFWGALAEEQGRTGGFVADEEGLVVGVPEADVEAMVDALLGNVFAHTPDGCAFAVQVGRDGTERAVLVVDDAGPGFSSDLVERGRSEGGSTGLGLDIVRRTVEAADGVMEIGESPLGGGRVRVLLPLRTRPRGRRGGAGGVTGSSPGR